MGPSRRGGWWIWALLVAAPLTGCDAKRLDRTEGRVAMLEARVDALTVRLATEQQIRATTTAPAPPAKPTAELVVSWPQKGGNDFRHTYATAADCDRARDAVLEESRRSRADVKAAQEKQAADAGLRMVFGSEAPSPSAVCVPI